jgi:hypothetical protein
MCGATHSANRGAARGDSAAARQALLVAVFSNFQISLKSIFGARKWLGTEEKY